MAIKREEVIIKQNRKYPLVLLLLSLISCSFNQFVIYQSINLTDNFRIL